MEFVFVGIEQLLRDNALDIAGWETRLLLGEVGYETENYVKSKDVDLSELPIAATEFGKPAVVLVKNKLGKLFLVTKEGEAVLANAEKCQSLDDNVLCRCFTRNRGKGARTRYWSNFWIKEKLGTICQA